MTRAYIALGSNLNHPLRQVSRALLDLKGLPRTRCVSHSRLFKTPPMGPPGQPDYINAVAVVDTALAPRVLLAQLLAIERAHGRVRGTERWGPRTLDLDLLVYGNVRLCERDLHVPHPELQRRAFVLYPLAEVAPELFVPGRGRVRDLLAHRGRDGIRLARFQPRRCP